MLWIDRARTSKVKTIFPEAGQRFLRPRIFENSLPNDI